MENAVDALKIAFAIFVFVLAITISFSLISQAKSTSDYVLYYADETNFYDNLNSKDTNRTVSVSDVISTLYRYYNESISVTVVLGENDDNIQTFDLALETNLSSSQIESNLATYINEKLAKTDDNATFTEEFVEVPISGIYKTGEDGTQITITSGTKKIYVTYTLQS